MNSLPELADEQTSTKKQIELNLSSYLDENFQNISFDFMQYFQFFPNLETLGNFINSLTKVLVNDTFTDRDQKLFIRSLCALLFNFSKVSNEFTNQKYATSFNNVEIETIKDKLNDSFITIQTLENSLRSKDEIIDQLTKDNTELEKDIITLKSKILKKKEKIDELKLKNRKVDINLDQEKISIINKTLTSQISSISEDNNYDKLVDEIYTLSNTIKFNDFEYKKLLESKHYCLSICQRLLDLCEEYESRISMAEEDRAILNKQILFISNENASLKQIIKETNKNDSFFYPDIESPNCQMPEESKTKSANMNNQDQNLQNKIENLNSTIRNQKCFINTLSTYIDKIITEGDDFIPLLYQSNQIIHDSSLQKIISESVESIKTSLFIDDYRDESFSNTQINSEDKTKFNQDIDLRNQFFIQIFGNPDILKEHIDKFINENNNDIRGYAVINALCAANLNLGNKLKDIYSRLSNLHSQLPREYQKDDSISSLNNFLIDSNEIFDKIIQINDSTSFFHFISIDLKTSINKFLTEISNFISNLQESVYQIFHYNKKNLSELPITLSNYINNIQAQNDELKIELDEYKERYKNEYQSKNSQQRYSNELNIKINEKDLQISRLQNYIKEKEKESQEYKSSSNSIIKEKNIAIQKYEIELNKIRKENETNSLLLKNTKKLHKSQIENVIKIEREKKEKEIKELKESISENEKTLILKLDSKKKKVKNLQNQIKEITKLFEKKMKKNNEKAEDIINQTSDQISIIEESFKQKEKQYQDEIEMLKSKLLEEIESNSSVKIIEVPAPPPFVSSFDAKNISNNNNNDIFVKQIFNILSDFPNCKLKMGSTFSTETAQSKIIKALQQLTDDFLNNSEKSKIINENLNSSNNTISKVKSPIVSAKRVVNTRDLRFWENWAVELAIIMNIPTNSMPEIRTAIRDVILSQNSKSFMLRNVQSLRTQKKLLIENDIYRLKFSMKNTVNLKGIIFFFISASCIAKTVKKKV